MSEQNTISRQQNQEAQVKQLAAQRELYSEAKETLVWQMILTIGLAVVFSMVVGTSCG